MAHDYSATLSLTMLSRYDYTNCTAIAIATTYTMINHDIHDIAFLRQESRSLVPDGTERRICLPLFVVDLAYTEAMEPSCGSMVDLPKVIRFHPTEEEFHTRLEVGPLPRMLLNLI